jgi:hypothetical protein
VPPMSPAFATVRNVRRVRAPGTGMSSQVRSARRPSVPRPARSKPEVAALFRALRPDSHDSAYKVV